MRLRLPLLLTLLFASPLQAATWRVSPSGDNTSGQSWETAFNLVGEAIAQSASGDQIWVASGTYNESIAMKEGVSLFGGFDGIDEGQDVESRDWKKNETILDATGLQTVVVEGASYCSLDGFNIVGGDNRKFQGRGGGVRLLSVRDVVIRNCVIEGNKVIPDPPNEFSGGGGGIAVINSGLKVVGCSILNNVSGFGGGMYIVDSDVQIEGTVIDGNMLGGIVHIGYFLDIVHCTFGMRNVMWSDSARADLDSTGCQNVITIRSSIIRKSTLTGCFNQEVSRRIAYSNIPGFPGNGNIDADPQWVDPENGDYRLKISSPCIDSGTLTDATMDFNGNPRPVDVIGIGVDGPGAYDMGAFEFQLSPADLTRNGTVDGEDLIEFQTQWMREE